MQQHSHHNDRQYCKSFSFMFLLEILVIEKFDKYLLIESMILIKERREKTNTHYRFFIAT